MATNSNIPGKGLLDALAQLAEEVAEARRRVAERERRIDEEKQALVEDRRALAELEKYEEAAQPFLKLMEESFPSASRKSSTAAPESSTLADQVVDVFRRRPTEVLTVDDVLQDLVTNGITTDTTSARNALYYSERRKRLRKAGRGKFSLDDSAPGSTGAEVSEEP